MIQKKFNIITSATWVMKCRALISTGPISNERSRSSHLVRTFNERPKSKGAIMEQEVQL